MRQSSRRRERPKFVTLADGATIPFEDGVWNFRSNMRHFALAFAHIPRLNDELVEGWKSTTAWFLREKSPAYGQVLHGIAVRFFRHTADQHAEEVGAISSGHILAYTSSLSKRRNHVASKLRIFLRRWQTLGLAGLEADAIEALNKMRFLTQPSGEAVLTHDPRMGAFTDIELEGIVSGINRSFRDGRLTQEEFVLVWLFLATGARPIQLAALKAKDLLCSEAADGTRVYWINLPQAKKRAPIRAHMKRMKLVSQVGELVKSHIDVTLKRALGAGLATVDEEDEPLFVGTGGGVGFERHVPSAMLTQRLQKALTLIGVVSERTGELLYVNARRFRYTLGSRAAVGGANVHQIAELLGHSTILTARIYVEARPEILERIDKAIALQMAPIAQAFAGVLVDRTKDPRLNDPTRFIIDPSVAEDAIGSCGKHSFCGLAAPISCYTCTQFYPWIDAAHEEVLNKLLQERERQLASHGDATIAAINDRLILAVAEVVLLCQQAQSGKASQ